jgi:hypothetical protein
MEGTKYVAAKKVKVESLPQT